MAKKTTVKKKMFTVQIGDELAILYVTGFSDLCFNDDNFKNAHLSYF